MLKAGVTSKGRKIAQLGCPKGAKDKVKRKRIGYLLRYAGKEAKKRGDLLTLNNREVAERGG